MRFVVKKLANNRGWLVVDTLLNIQASGICKTKREAVTCALNLNG